MVVQATTKKGFYFTQPDNLVMFDETLSQTAKVVYCSLLSHVRKGTNKCKLFISTIAEETKRSVRTVRRALSQLCAKGIIVRIMQYGNHKNQLASLFIIIGRNAACYKDNSASSTSSKAISSATTATKAKIYDEHKISINLESEVKGYCKGQQSESFSVPRTKASAPHAKNGMQNNNRCKNDIVSNTLIGQAELPKSSASRKSSSGDGTYIDVDTQQICIDFEAYEALPDEVSEDINQEDCIESPQTNTVLITAKEENEPETVDTLGVADKAQPQDNNTLDPLALSRMLIKFLTICWILPVISSIGLDVSLELSMKKRLQPCEKSSLIIIQLESRKKLTQPAFVSAKTRSH